MMLVTGAPRNKSILRYSLSLPLCVSLVVTSALSSGAWASDSAARSELEALRDELRALASTVARQSKEIEDLKSQLTAKPRPISTTVVAAPIENTESVVSPVETTTQTASAENGTEEAPQDEIKEGPRQPVGRFPDDAIVTAGDFKGSIAIPNTDLSVRIGGFIRAEGNYDFDSLGFQDSVSHRRIPLDGTADDDSQQTRFHVRNSRLNFDIRHEDTALGPLRAFVEFDFFGGGNEFISGYDVRIRHIAAQIGNLYVGQWWSYFTDVTSNAETAVFGGLLGSPSARNPGVRWADDFGDGWRYGVGIENPAGDISGDEALLASDSVPNMTGFIQLKRSWGQLRIAGLGLQLESTDDSVFTGGANVTGRIFLPFINDQDNISFQAQAGAGFTHYYLTLSTVGLDGVIDENGNIEATGILSGNIAFQHWWTDTLRSTLQASFLELDSPAASDGSALDSGQYYAANVFWTPVDNVTFGTELIWARQETVSGDEGSGVRLQAIARIDF